MVKFCDPWENISDFCDVYTDFLFFVLIFEVLSLKCFEKVLVKGLLASCSPA